MRDFRSGPLIFWLPVRRAAIIKGSLSPLIQDVAPRAIAMSKVKLMITGDDMKEERAALHRGVLAALKSKMRSHMVDFGWNDSGWGAEDEAGGDMWMNVVESESCVIDSPPLWGGATQSLSPVIVRQPEAHERCRVFNPPSPPPLPPRLVT